MPAAACPRRAVVLPLMVLALMAAVLLGPVPGASAASAKRVAFASSIALQQLGDPYRWGGTGPNAFDCSGLVQYSFRRAGIAVPRTAAAQAGRAHHIARSKLRRGDLMFFSNGGRVYHVAIFLRWVRGKPEMVHAPRTGQDVRRAYPWTNSWFAGTLRG
ncbi:MAG: C40 family peptidase [Marmoricola sp.]